MAVEWMTKLWQVEKTVRGQSPKARVAAHQQTCAAVVAKLSAADFAALPRQTEAHRDGPLCDLASRHLRALPDRRPHQARLQHRRTRKQTSGNHGKNALFAGSNGGGWTSVTIATLPRTENERR